MSDNETDDAVIVVGLDGSETSWDAFSWAAGEALRSRARLVAAYVSPRQGAAAAVVGGAYDYGAVERARAEVAADLAAAASGRAAELGIDIDFVHEQGEVSRSLTSIARAARARMVVIGRSAKARHHLAGALSQTHHVPPGRAGGRRRSLSTALDDTRTGETRACDVTGAWEPFARDRSRPGRAPGCRVPTTLADPRRRPGRRVHGPDRLHRRQRGRPADRPGLPCLLTALEWILERVPAGHLGRADPRRPPG